MLFKPYAGLERGRLIGNGCIPVPKNVDRYATSNAIDATPWGGYAETLANSRIGKGDNFWNLGFATVTLDGPDATARYFQLADADRPNDAGRRRTTSSRSDRARRRPGRRRPGWMVPGRRR